MLKELREGIPRDGSVEMLATEIGNLTSIAGTHKVEEINQPHQVIL